MEYNKKREWEEKNNIRVAVIGHMDKEQKNMTLLEAMKKISSDKEDIGKEPGE